MAEGISPSVGAAKTPDSGGLAGGIARSKPAFGSPGAGTPRRGTGVLGWLDGIDDYVANTLKPAVDAISTYLSGTVYANLQRRAATIAVVSNSVTSVQNLLAAGSYNLYGISLTTTGITTLTHCDLTITPASGSAISFRVNVAGAAIYDTYGTNPFVCPFYGLAVTSVTVQFDRNVAGAGGTVNAHALYV